MKDDKWWLLQFFWFTLSLKNNNSHAISLVSCVVALTIVTIVGVENNFVIFNLEILTVVASLFTWSISTPIVSKSKSSLDSHMFMNFCWVEATIVQLHIVATNFALVQNVLKIQQTHKLNSKNVAPWPPWFVLNAFKLMTLNCIIWHHCQTRNLGCMGYEN